MFKNSQEVKDPPQHELSLATNLELQVTPHEICAVRIGRKTLHQHQVRTYRPLYRAAQICKLMAQNHQSGLLFYIRLGSRILPIVPYSWYYKYQQCFVTYLPNMAQSTWIHATAELRKRLTSRALNHRLVRYLLLYYRPKDRLQKSLRKAIWACGSHK